MLTVLGHSQPSKKSEEKLEQKLEVETMGEDFLLAFSQARAALAFLYSRGHLPREWSCPQLAGSSYIN